VGNLLNDSPNGHAIKIVGLALDILCTLKYFNDNKNPTTTPIHLRIGIHSDSIVRAPMPCLLLVISHK